MKKQVDLEEPVVKFFDFYTMYELYLRAGGFREEGYAAYPVFVNERIWNKIVDKYEETVDQFYSMVYEALVTAVGREMRHFPHHCNDYVTGQEQKFYKNLRTKGKITQDEIREAQDDVEKYADVAVKLFSIPQWACSYGGRKWAAAAQMLADSKKLKTRHQKVFWCDKVMDLHHNTGHLLNKTYFRCLSDACIPTKNGKYCNPLNFRAKANSVVKFVPYVSSSVRRLTIPRKRLLEVAA